MPKFTTCHLANVSVCALSQENANFTVVFYNPLAQQRAFPVRIPLAASSTSATVTDGSGTVVASTVVKNTLPGTLPSPSRLFVCADRGLV